MSNLNEASKQDEAGLILKLYELRRDETMRQARNWFFAEFNPESMADVQAALMGEHSGHLRMVMSYWDMAAALVNHGAISADFFDDTNSEHVMIFGKLEPFLGEARSYMSPMFLSNLEKLIDSIPDGRKRAATMRERVKAMRERLAARPTDETAAV